MNELGFFQVSVSHELNGHTFAFLIRARNAQHAAEIVCDEGSYYQHITTTELSKSQFMAALAAQNA